MERATPDRTSITELEKELKKELVNFPNRLKTKEQFWTKEDLLQDFEKLRKNKENGVAENAAGAVVTLLDYTILGSALIADFFQTAQDFIADAVKGAAVDYSVDVLLQPRKIGGLEADKKMIATAGTTVTMSIITALTGGAFPPTLALGAFFTIIIYLKERGLEVQKRRDTRLADKLWDNFEKIRDKSQKKLDARHIVEVQRNLMSNFKHDVEGAVLIKGTKATETETVQLLNALGNPICSTNDAALAFKRFQISPKSIPVFEDEKKKTIIAWLRGLEAERAAWKAQRLKDLATMQEDLQIINMEESSQQIETGPGRQGPVPHDGSVPKRPFMKTATVKKVPGT